MSSAMAAAPTPRLDSVLSFGNALPGADTTRPATDERDDFSDAGSDYDDDDAGFEFAFAPPLGVAPGTGGGAEGDVVDLAPADDLFAHGRILPAYPVFDRHLLDRCYDDDATTTARASAVPPSPDTYYCEWAPRSAPGSPARDFAKSASTGEAQARRSWRLRDLVFGAGGGRSHSDGKEKFLFLQPTSAAPSKMAGGSKATAEVDGNRRQGARPSAPPQKQSRKKGGKVPAAAAVTEMDMATAHKLFAGDRRRQQQQSYLPYRPGIVGFFIHRHARARPIARQ